MGLKRQRNGARPVFDTFENRCLLSFSPPLGPLLKVPPATVLVRPNTPVAPFGAPAITASFIDPSARILHGQHAIIGQQSLIGPSATIDSRFGFVKIGSGSAVLDNATVRSTANGLVLIGDNATIEFGATVIGPAIIGAIAGQGVPPVEIGPNALIDGATIEPGAIVSGLARVGPGVVIPAGIRVLPGKNVTNEAEATNPALGQVAKITPDESTRLSALVLNDQALAAGYSNLYQGNAATGQNSGVSPSVTGVYSGQLSNVEGTGPEPGTKFEPGKYGPRFASTRGGLVEGLFPTFRVRATGTVYFEAKPNAVARLAGLHDSIRADQSQPITFAGAPRLASNVSINAPLTASGEGGGALPAPGAGTGFGTGAGANLGNILFPEPGQSFTEPDQRYSNPGANGLSLSNLLGKIDAAAHASGFATPSLPPPPIAASNLVIGRDFQAGFGAVVLGGQSSLPASSKPRISFIIGDNVSIGDGAVVERSSIGHDSVIGAHSLVSASLLAPNTVIPPGTIVVRNQIVGRVQW